MQTVSTEKEMLRADPVRFFNDLIKDYIAHSPNNEMPGFPGERIWDEPLVGFADGDDPLFQEYKQIISPFHQTPREALEAHLKKVANGYPRPEKVTAVAFILPSTQATRESMRRESQVCSLRWNYTRHYGQECLNRLSRFAQTQEPVLVQAFVPHLAVEALDESILHRLPRFDEVQLHALLVGPHIQSLARKLRPVIRHQDLRQPSSLPQLLQYAHHDYPMARFLYVYVNRVPDKGMDPLTREFVRLILSKEGQLTLHKSFLVPVRTDIPPLTPALDQSKLKVFPVHAELAEDYEKYEKQYHELLGKRSR